MRKAILCVCLSLFCAKLFAVNPADELYRKAEGSDGALVKIHYFSKAIKANEDPAWPFLFMAYYNRGVLYRSIGLNEKALWDFDRAASFSTSMYKAHQQKAEIYSKMKKYEQAIMAYNKAFDLSLEKKQPYHKRALLYFKLGMYDQAYEDFQREIEAGSRNEDFYFFRAVCLLHLNRYERAIKHFELLEKRNPENPLIQFLLGTAYYLLYLERNIYLLRYNFAEQPVIGDQRLEEYQRLAQKYLIKAFELGFDLNHELKWNKIKRIQENMDQFLDFLAQVNIRL